MRKLQILLVSLLAVFLVSGTALAVPVSLSNQALTADDYRNYFSGPFFASPNSISGYFDFGVDNVNDGQIYSGVEKSTLNTYGNGSQYLYAYLYSIEVYSNSVHSVSGLTIQFGGTAPVSFDFGNGSADSFYGAPQNVGDTYSWNSAYVDDSNPPYQASYNSADGGINWSFPVGYSINPGEKSTWLIALSLVEPNTTVNFNVLNSGGGEEVGVIYAPVPEPATMLLLGTGLAGLVGLGRKKFFKKS